LGLDLLRGAATVQSIPSSRRRFLLRLALSSVQSALFNAVVADRLRDGLLHTVLRGDVMQVASTGGQFIVEDAQAEQIRLDRREIVPTGPMFGPKMRQPSETPAEREDRVLATWDLTRDNFAMFPQLTSGTRRPAIIWPESLRIASEAAGLRVEFQLPSGAYATTVLRELMKADDERSHAPPEH
jgi:tRNA pseudouridine13 synthase